MEKQEKQQPNEKLRYWREMRGWSQRYVAERIGTGETEVSRWECGVRKPGRYYQTRLCALFEKTAQELGFMHVPPSPVTSLRIDTQNETMQEADMDKMRRQIIQELVSSVSLAMLPLHLRDALVHQKPEIERARPDKTTLQAYTNILDACWQLSKGNELALAEDFLLMSMTKLVPLAQQISPHQQTFANLTAQGFRLYNIFALHRNDLQAKEQYSKQAVQYSRISDDQNLLIASLKGLATTYYYSSKYSQSLQTYQDALSYIDKASPLLQACVYMGLAVSYTHVNQQKDAFHYLELSLDTFPDIPENDPSFHYADFDHAQMILWEGLTRIQLGQTEQAINTFQRIEQQNSSPGRIRIEIINCQAKAAILSGDVELSAALVEAGGLGARELQSQRRYNEAYDNFKQCSLFWPQEKRTESLKELFHS